jgi:hypothetical protein
LEPGVEATKRRGGEGFGGWDKFLKGVNGLRILRIGESE